MDGQRARARAVAAQAAHAPLRDLEGRHADDKIDALRRIEDEAKLVRYGCDCYAFAMLAAGQVDCVMEAGVQAYDVVALIPIVEGAGGIMTTWTGGDASKGGDVIACGDHRLHEEALARLGAAGPS